MDLPYDLRVMVYERLPRTGKKLLIRVEWFANLAML